MANGGGGALEAQQQIGASIPYKNIAVAEHGLDRFLNAFQIGVNINRQRLAYERMLNQMQMENEKINMQREALQSRTEHMGVMEQLAARNADYREAALGLREETSRLKTEQATQNADRLTDLNTEIAGFDGTRGSAAHWAWLNKIHHDYADVIGNTTAGDRAFKEATAAYNRAAGEKTKATQNTFKMMEEARKMAGGVSWYDLTQPDTVWGQNAPSTGFPQGSSFVAHDAKTGDLIPIDKIPEFQKAHAKDPNQGLRFTTVHTPDLARARGMRDIIQKTLQGTLDDKPGPPMNTRIIEKDGHHYEVDDASRSVIRQVD